jgi:hypothetical protein
MGLFVVQRNCIAPTYDAFPHERGAFATSVQICGELVQDVQMGCFPVYSRRCDWQHQASMDQVL